MPFPAIPAEEWTQYQGKKFRTRALQAIADRLKDAPSFDVGPYRGESPAATLQNEPSNSNVAPTVVKNATVRAPGSPLPEDLVPNQFGAGQGLTTGEAYAACGPAAAVAFAKAQGRNPTLAEAVQLAKQYGWTEQQGMAGPQSEKGLMDALGVKSRVETGVDWAKVRADVEAGNPVAISTPAHYFVATGFNPDTGQFNFQASGEALKAGGRWLKPDQVASLGKGIQATIYVDNPDPATGPSVATQPPASPNPQPTEAEITAYIQQSAQARGIDPDTAVRAADTEGGRKEPARRGTFNTGSSWWPFQLHYGGKGYEDLGTTAGMGNSFTAETGWKPGDPAAWRASVDYALDGVAKNGWGAWYGPKKIGITGRAGLSPDAKPLGVDPANLPGASAPSSVNPTANYSENDSAPTDSGFMTDATRRLEERFGALLPKPDFTPAPRAPLPDFMATSQAKLDTALSMRAARAPAAPVASPEPSSASDPPAPVTVEPVQPAATAYPPAQPTTAEARAADYYPDTGIMSGVTPAPSIAPAPPEPAGPVIQNLAPPNQNPIGNAFSALGSAVRTVLPDQAENARNVGVDPTLPGPREAIQASEAQHNVMLGAALAPIGGAEAGAQAINAASTVLPPLARGAVEMAGGDETAQQVAEVAGGVGPALPGLIKGTARVARSPAEKLGNALLEAFQGAFRGDEATATPAVADVGAATAKGTQAARQDLTNVLANLANKKAAGAAEAEQVDAFVNRVAPDYAQQQTEEGRLHALLGGLSQAPEAAFPAPAAPQVAAGSGAEAGLRALGRQVTPPAQPSIDQLHRDLQTILNATPDERVAFMERMRGGPENPEALRTESTPGPVRTAAARSNVLNFPTPKPTTASEDLAGALEESLRARGVDPANIKPRPTPAIIGGLGGAAGASQDQGEESDDNRALKILAAAGLGAVGAGIAGRTLRPALSRALAQNGAIRALRESTDAINLLPDTARGVVRNLGDNFHVADALATAEAKAAHEEAMAAGFTAREATDYATSAFKASRTALAEEARQSALADLVRDGATAAILPRAAKPQPGWINGSEIGPLYAGHQFSPDAAFILRKVERAGEKMNPLDYVRAAWINALLTSPVGRIRDSLSSTFSVVSAPLETVAAVPFDVAASLRTGQRTVFLAEAPAQVQGMVAGLSTGFHDAMKIIRYGFTDQQVRRDLAGVADEVLPGALNLPGRLIGANDAFFKGLTRSGSVYAQAVNIAKREGLSGEAYVNRLAELRARPLPKMLERADQDAKYRAFQADSVLANWLSSVKGRKDAVGYGTTAVLPFHSTAIALAKYGMERTPIGLVMLGNDWRAGRAGQREIAEGVARMGLGSALMYQGWNLATGDNLTGAAPKDPTESDAFYRQGKQPYSIRVNGKWYSYQGAPFAPLLGIVSSMYGAVKRGETDNAPALWMLGAGAAAKAMMDQPFLAGLQQLSDLIEDPERNANTYAESWARSVVPQVVQVAARASDDIIRNPDGFAEALLTGVPGLSGTLNPRLTGFGEPARREQQGLATLNPLRPTTARDDPVERELARLQGRGYKVQPSTAAPKELRAGPGRATLTRDEQLAYRQAAGKLAYGFLVPIMAAPEWRSVPDNVKDGVIAGVYRNAHSIAAAQLTPQLLQRGIADFEQKRAKGEELD